MQEAIEYVQAALAAQADPVKAGYMAAYMRTGMPFYGVQKPARAGVQRELFADFPPADRDEYEALVLGLWALPHREEKYLALGVAGHFKKFVGTSSLPLYRRLIVEGAWWDFVDEVATHIVRRVILEEPASGWREVDTWIQHDDMWLRRSAILCQVGAKERTDPTRLFAFCEARIDEKEFFIRKAIGWSLREYARTDPDAVAQFAMEHRDRLSRLSFREATKHIQHLIR